MNLMMLTVLQLFQGARRRMIIVGGLEPLADNAIENQREEAKARVRLHALGQAVSNGSNAISDFSSRPPLDIRQRLVPTHNAPRRQILTVGDEQQLVIHQFRQGQSIVIDVVREQLVRHIHENDMGQPSTSGFTTNKSDGIRVSNPRSRRDFPELRIGARQGDGNSL